MSTLEQKLTAGISHVGLSVTDLESSFKFFEAIGFYIVGGVKTYPAYFISDGASLIDLWQTDEGAAPFDRRKNVGLHHLAIKVANKEAINTVYEKALTVEGVKSEFGPQELPELALMHAMVYEPSGNRIEFTYHSE